MIRNLSETLRAMLDDPALAGSFPELAAAQIVFDRPGEGFTPSVPTLDLFLYDVRENMELRSNEPLIERNNGQAIIHRPPLRVACSYLITAWPVGGSDLVLQEHRLLSQALMVLASHPTIPAQYLKGALVGQEPPLPMLSSNADGLKNPSEFWTALGNKLRPSIVLTVTVSMQPFAQETAKIATGVEVRIGERISPHEESIKMATMQGHMHVAGLVTDAADAAMAGASVTISTLGLSTTTDPDGRYSFGSVPQGSYTMSVKSGSVEKNVSLTVPATAGSNYNVKLTG